MRPAGLVHARAERSEVRRELGTAGGNYPRVARVMRPAGLNPFTVVGAVVRRVDLPPLTPPEDLPVNAAMPRPTRLTVPSREMALGRPGVDLPEQRRLARA